MQYLMGGKEGVKENDDADDKAQFSIRLPKTMLDQIEARRAISKRSRNREIEYLLEQALDYQVQKDQELIRRMADMNPTLKSNPS